MLLLYMSSVIVLDNNLKVQSHKRMQQETKKYPLKFLIIQVIQDGTFSSQKLKDAILFVTYIPRFSAQEKNMMMNVQI